MSSLSGFISAVFGLLLTIALTLTVVYWQEKKWRRAKILGAISFVCAAVTVIAYAFQYLSPAPPPPPPVQTIGPPEKPYLFIKVAKMEELTAGKAPVVMMEVQNGPNESTFFFKNVTFKLSVFVPETYLHYDKNEPLNKPKAAPRQILLTRWVQESLILSQEQIDELNAASPTKELYAFAQGEYTDETGTHPLNVCWQYDRDFPTHLIFCRDNIRVE